jgi:hypothetical protein
MDHQLDTASYPDGALSLSLTAANAAGVASSPAEKIYVDNQPVTLTLAGPTDAPTTAGIQYISATAAAGPSGVQEITCSLDGAPPQSYSATSARVAVQGVGPHQLSCIAHNGAVDPLGQFAASSLQTWSLSIREPSVSTVSFERLVQNLRCARKRRRVRVPAQWTTVHVHGQPVRVKIPAQTRTVTVMHCHPRFAWRRVRDGDRWRRERVLVLPRTVHATTKHVPFGQATAVSGWLGTTRGDALGRQHVAIYTAPDDGRETFILAAQVTTAPDGSWSARLPPGPSRIVKAVYAGSPTVEPSASPPARIVVPASISLSLRPRNTHWGGSIVISGHVRGGYVPPVGELVVLRVGWSGGSAEIGHLYTRRDGSFQSRYTFLRGTGTETYEIWAATARESDYPYAPSNSRPASVTVRP